MKNKTIVKYPIKLIDEQEIKIKYWSGPKIIYVGLDEQGTLCILNLEGSEDPMVTVKIIMIGTGSPLPRHESEDYGWGYDHIGSFTKDSFMWHVFIG